MSYTFTERAREPAVAPLGIRFLPPRVPPAPPAVGTGPGGFSSRSDGFPFRISVAPESEAECLLEDEAQQLYESFPGGAW